MINTLAEELISRINQDMRQAMKDRDSVKLSELRTLSSLINGAEAVASGSVASVADGSIAGAGQGVGSTEVRRKQLAASDILAIIQTEIRELEGTLEKIDSASDYAAELREKIAIVKQYE